VDARGNRGGGAGGRCFLGGETIGLRLLGGGASACCRSGDAPGLHRFCGETIGLRLLRGGGAGGRCFLKSSFREALTEYMIALADVQAA